MEISSKEERRFGLDVSSNLLVSKNTETFLLRYTQLFSIL